MYCYITINKNIVSSEKVEICSFSISFSFLRFSILLMCIFIVNFFIHAYLEKSFFDSTWLCFYNDIKFFVWFLMEVISVYSNYVFIKKKKRKKICISQVPAVDRNLLKMMLWQEKAGNLLSLSINPRNRVITSKLLFTYNLIIYLTYPFF